MGYSPWGRKESDMTERLTLTLASQGTSGPSGDTSGVTSGGDGDTTGTWWGESRDGTEHAAAHGPAPHNQSFFGAKMSIMIRSPTLEDALRLLYSDQSHTCLAKDSQTPDSYQHISRNPHGLFRMGKFL